MEIGIRNGNTTVITLRNWDGSRAGTISSTKAAKKKIKKLQYNYTEVSSQIMRAKTAGTSLQAVSKARLAVATLRKKLKTGEYDDRELQIAIVHAEAMERVAKKRMKHLQEEENAGKKGGVCEAELETEEEKEADYSDLDTNEDMEVDYDEMEALMEELQEAMKEMEMPDELDELEELGSVVRKDMDPEDLEQLKKKHRSDELRDIMKADMKYLKALFEKFEKERQQAANGISGNTSNSASDSSISGVALELAGVEVVAANAPAQTPVPAEGGSIDVTA